MTKGAILKTTLPLGIVLLLVGAVFKITHWPGADLLLSLGLLAALAFLVTALVEVATARYVARGTRLLWMSVLLLGGLLGAVFYLLVGRRHVGATRAG